MPRFPEQMSETLDGLRLLSWAHYVLQYSYLNEMHSQQKQTYVVRIYFAWRVAFAAVKECSN